MALMRPDVNKKNREDAEESAERLMQQHRITMRLERLARLLDAPIESADMPPDSLDAASGAKDVPAFIQPEPEAQEINAQLSEEVASEVDEQPGTESTEEPTAASGAEVPRAGRPVLGLPTRLPTWHHPVLDRKHVARVEASPPSAQRSRVRVLTSPVQVSKFRVAPAVLPVKMVATGKEPRNA